MSGSAQAPAIRALTRLSRTKPDHEAEIDHGQLILAGEKDCCEISSNSTFCIALDSFPVPE